MIIKKGRKVRRGAIHHLDLSVTNLRRSGVFYDRLLGFFCYRRVRLPGNEGVDGLDWLAQEGGAGWSTIGMYQVEGSRKTQDRRAPGLHHLAFHAGSREDVDNLHRVLLEMGATILYPPSEYPEYGKGYYAVFFLDPDGIKLEAVYDASLAHQAVECPWKATAGRRATCAFRARRTSGRQP